MTTSGNTNDFLTSAHICMKSPWDISEAFEPMFDDQIAVTRNGVRYPVKACVFPIEQVDPFVDSDYQNDVKLISALIRKRGIPKGWKPQVGDEVQLANGEKYKASEIEDEQIWFKMTARSK